MEALQISETNETPSINLDKKKGQFQFIGRSLTDNASEFYQPAIDWLKAYAEAPNSETDIVFKFEYLNTVSSKSVLDILTALEKVKGAKVSWYFNEEDEDMEEIGEEIAELVTVPFNFIIYS